MPPGPPAAEPAKRTPSDEPPARRLDHEREAEAAPDLVERLGRAELAEGERVERGPVGGRDAGGRAARAWRATLSIDRMQARTPGPV